MNKTQNTKENTNSQPTILDKVCYITTTVGTILLAVFVSWFVFKSFSDHEVERTEDTSIIERHYKETRDVCDKRHEDLMKKYDELIEAVKSLKK